MKLRNAGVVAVVLTAMVSCDRGQDRGTPAVAPVTQGGTSDPWSAREPAKDPLKKPLFWRLEKDGKASYVLGTMHLGVDPTTRLPDVVWQQLDAKPTFAMEADLSDPSKLGIHRTDGKTLRDELGDEYWAKLEAALGSQARAMMKMKAMIPATVLAMRGLPQTAPMDSTLLARAKNQRKNIVYLETLESEGVVLEKWMNARALKDMLDDPEGTEQRARKMLDAYVAGEGEQMMAVFEEERAIWKKKGHPESEFDEQLNDLLYKRNASWIAPIEKLHAEGGGFIAIGAAHALGPGSVLDLLAKQGFVITRVTP